MGTTDQKTNLFPWHEYRLLLLAVLLGVVGGLSAQIFVALILVSFGEKLLMVGFAGYVPPEHGTLNPSPIIGPSRPSLMSVVTTPGGIHSGILAWGLAPGGR